MSIRQIPNLILVLQKLMQPKRQTVLQDYLCKTLFCDHLCNKQRDAKHHSDIAAKYSPSGSSLVFKLLSPDQRPSYCDVVTVKTARQEKPAVVMKHKTFWHDSRRIPFVGRPLSEAASDLVNARCLLTQSLSLLIQFVTPLRPARPSEPRTYGGRRMSLLPAI